MSISYYRTTKSDFIITKQPEIDRLILNTVAYSVDEYDYPERLKYNEIGDPYFYSLFTSNDRNELKIPHKNSKYGLTKYVLNKDYIRHPDYKIKFVVFTRRNSTGYYFSYYNGFDIINRISENFGSKVVMVLMEKISEPEIKELYYYDFQKLENTQREHYQIFKELCDELSELNKDNYEEKLKSIYMKRHNMMQCYICYLLGLDPVLDTDLNLLDFGIESKQTPDFFYKDGNFILVGDITVKSDSIEGLIEKEEKYRELVYKIIDAGFIPKTMFLSFDHEFRNMSVVLENIHVNKIHERDYDFETLILDFVDSFSDARLRNISDHVSFLKKFQTRGEIVNSEKIDMLKELPDYGLSTKMDFLKNENTSLQQFEYLKNILDSKETFNVLDDKIFDSSMCSEYLEKLNSKNLDYNFDWKPTNYIAIPPDDVFDRIRGPNSEQDMIVQFITILKNAVKDSFSNRLFEIFDDCYNGKYSETQKNMFMNGIYFDTENEEEEHKSSYNDVKKGNYSYREYLINEGFNVPPPGENFFRKKKIIQITESSFRDESLSFLQKAGIHFFKKNPEGRVYKDKTTVDMETAYDCVEDFLDLLTTKDERSFVPEEIYEGFGKDQHNSEKLKEMFCDELKDISQMLEKFYAHTYLKHSSQIYEELIHTGNLSLPSNCYTFINSGLPGILIVAVNASRLQTQNVGIPFCMMGVTRSKKFLDTKIFGDLYVEPVEDYFFYRTKWARIPSFRMEFFRDQYYSVLSTTISTLNRYNQHGITKKDIRGTLSLRALISLTSAQCFAEKIMDARFAIMSCFSEYTNFEELIFDKFGPPYKNAIDAWVVSKILKRMPSFKKELEDNGSVRFYNAVIDENNRRSVESMGGTFKLNGIWSDRRIYVIDDILDEIFIYVHTPKEPSNQFHQEIEAVKTIIKYQQHYDNLSEKEKMGINYDEDEKDGLLDWLDSDKPVGFDCFFLKAACDNYFYKKEQEISASINICLNEKFSELNSTKAVIPDSNRKFTGLDKLDALRLRNIMKKYEKAPVVVEKLYKDKILKAQLNDEVLSFFKTDPHNKNIEITNKSVKINNKFINIKTHARLVNKKEKEKVNSMQRTKVHDEMLKYCNDWGLEYTYSNAISYMVRDGRVVSDICIKAQYGSKREFYVMNMGAKIMAKCVENFFKKMASYSTTEMISTPGDKKMIVIQKMIDRVTKHAIKNKNFIYYVNGDCSKWSASEMMETFLTMVVSLENKCDSNYFLLMKYIISKWMNKEIQIPADVLDKVIPLTKDTNYLRDTQENNFKLKSTQNFLQGVFNYMSSLKADICNKFVLDLWNHLYPESDLYAEFLVHSDDYVVAISTPNKEELQKFRRLQKISMRCCGITDSVKKTNIQKVFMEFVSLISFNGATCYPTIKKTKECASTLPCDDYRRDSDMVCSRTSECVRVGVDEMTCYHFHRIHMYLLRRMYSLHKFGYNEIENKFEKPTEMFGQSDMLPTFYLLCKGDKNNLRILKYCDDVFLRKLLTLNVDSDNTNYQFPTPRFIYNRNTSKIVSKRKSLSITAEEAFDFFKKNKPYNFIKPNNFEDYKKWLECMYFKNSFVKAYNRDTRTIRLLRVSFYTKRQCCTLMDEQSLNEFYIKRSEITDNSERRKFDDDNLLTIRETSIYLESLEPSAIDNEDLLKIVLNGDSTPLQLYKWMDNATIEKSELSVRRNFTASLAPLKPTWINVGGSLSKILIYCFSEELFLKNYPNEENLKKCIAAKKEINKALPGLLDKIQSEDEKENNSSMLLLYNSCYNSIPEEYVCINKSRGRQQVEAYYVSRVRYNTFPDKEISLTHRNVYVDINPYTMKEKYVIGKNRSSSFLRKLINNITLIYILYMYKFNKSYEETLKKFREFIIFDGVQRHFLENYLDTIDYEKAISNNLSNNELSSFCFFKKMLCNDDIAINSFSKSGKSFEYHYIKTGNKPECFYTIGNFRCISRFEGETVEVITNCKSISMYPVIYAIALKLSGKISQLTMERIVEGSKDLKFSTIFKPKSGNYYYNIENKPIIKLADKDEPETNGLPIYYIGHLTRPVGVLKKMEINHSPIYKIKGISMYNGKMKMFNLKFYYCSYCDVFIDTGDEIYNEIINNKLLEEIILRSGFEVHFEPSRLLLDWCLENIVLPDDSRNVKERFESKDMETKKTGSEKPVNKLKAMSQMFFSDFIMDDILTIAPDTEQKDNTKLEYNTDEFFDLNFDNDLLAEYDFNPEKSKKIEKELYGDFGYDTGYIDTKDTITIDEPTGLSDFKDKATGYLIETEIQFIDNSIPRSLIKVVFGRDIYHTILELALKLSDNLTYINPKIITKIDSFSRKTDGRAYKLLQFYKNYYKKKGLIDERICHVNGLVTRFNDDLTVDYFETLGDRIIDNRSKNKIMANPKNYIIDLKQEIIIKRGIQRIDKKKEYEDGFRIRIIEKYGYWPDIKWFDSMLKNNMLESQNDDNLFDLL